MLETYQIFLLPICQLSYIGSRVNAECFPKRDEVSGSRGTLGLI